MICRKHHHGRLFGFNFLFSSGKMLKPKVCMFHCHLLTPRGSCVSCAFLLSAGNSDGAAWFLIDVWFSIVVLLLSSCCCLLVVVFLLLLLLLLFTISPGITGNNRGRFFRMLGNPSVVSFSVFKSSSVLGCEIQSTSLYVSTSNLLLLPEPEGKSKKGYFWETM